VIERNSDNDVFQNSFRRFKSNVPRRGKSTIPAQQLRGRACTHDEPCQQKHGLRANHAGTKNSGEFSLCVQMRGMTWPSSSAGIKRVNARRRGSSSTAGFPGSWINWHGSRKRAAALLRKAAMDICCLTFPDPHRPVRSTQSTNWRLCLGGRCVGLRLDHFQRA